MKKIVIPGILVLLIISVVLFSVKKHKTNLKQQQKDPTVQVSYGNIEVKVLSTGTIQPYTRVEVKPPVNGRLDKIEAQEGDKVYENKVLALLSSEERVAIITSAESDLSEAKKSGDNASIESAQKSYEMVKGFYKSVPINASISGEIIKRDCEPGQNVTTATVLFVISDKLVANVSVDEADIRNISIGYPAQIVLDAFPDQEITGRVVKISHESRLVSNVNIYDVMVVPDSIPEYWRSGMTANVNFIIQSKDNVLSLPLSIVRERKGFKGAKKSANADKHGKQGQWAGSNSPKRDSTSTRKRNNKYVFLLENGKSVERDVQTGLSDGANIEITSGLKEGDTVIFKIETSPQTGPNSSRARQMTRMMPH
ncbi:MAG: efflux RND transporter periplasmic adaptor subunit [bacterium]|nr:efflux RND transporter periplasmic adaptor subunit [bacterium]